MTSSHATDRLRERFSPDDAARYAKLVQYIASKLTTSSHAVQLAKLDSMVGRAWSNTSNGDAAWCIIRNGEVATVMYRRSSQPSTAYALKVEHVWTLTVQADKLTLRAIQAVTAR